MLKMIYILMSAAVFLSCEKKNEADSGAQAARAEIPPQSAALPDKLRLAFAAADIPPKLAQAALRDREAFIAALEAACAGDAALYRLVDKHHPLSPLEYEPEDLVTLETGAYRVGRAGLKLRRAAEEALEAMAQAARADGLTLTASSAYRSYRYQTEVYTRNVRESGQETADRESARPGDSQHQTGLAVDFGSISDAFAQTAEGKWMLANAAAFGWSLSFPDGYEALTGYRWESWHYRYVGVRLTRFIDRYFEGIQQYALRFIYEWRRL